MCIKFIKYFIPQGAFHGWQRNLPTQNTKFPELKIENYSKTKFSNFDQGI